jgi:large subunit ribosomal protein L3
MARTGVIAQKLGMSSMFNDKGERLTITLLQMQDCVVAGQRTTKDNGYDAVIVGSTICKAKKVSKPLRMVFSKLEIEPRAILKEFRVDENNLLNIGHLLTPSHFVRGQFIDVTGKSIGKGFAGGMKRHNFRGLEETHGVSVSHRSHGSTGACQHPGKVLKNKKMAGRLGGETVTIQNLRIIDTDEQRGIIIVSGNIPGPKGKYVLVRDAVKK